MSSSSQIPVVVTFSGVDLAPLTTRPETLAEDVERYLQRVAPGELRASVNPSLGIGCVRTDDRTVANFRVAILGGAA
ncbi:hypothetical protein [Streptomyces sp. AC555_RSS877]|uniref:hypothetical protein n=1 Tax=Streptomyces sp. AC555_RSS877 TaxID=2823688 RepID=UPI001C27493F|nr:hypothetical protein [Streptomyces sp. AC555_RSS877]